ncbi:hypothetical protein BH10BAC1_BH10BAC1_04130 [soil metagenome]
MKKFILLLVFILLFIGQFRSQDTIFAHAWTPSSARFFDMNNRDTTNRYIYIDSTQTNNIWQLGTPSKTLFNAAYSAPWALVTDTINTYPNSNTSSFSFIVWTDCNWFALYFSYRINTDSLLDGGVLEYSTNGGTSWTNIIDSPYTLYNYYSASDSLSSNSNQPGFTGTRGWSVAGFSGPTLNTVVEFRFTFTSDSINTNRDGWMIDDLIINGLMVDINEIETNASLQIFPNPTSDVITIISSNAIQLKSFLVRDILGRIVLYSDQTTIDLSKFETGIYFIEIVTDKRSYIKRIVKK